MTTRTITATEHLTVLKHLAAGKAHHVVATITRLNVKMVQELAEEAGYPDRDKLTAAVARLEEQIEQVDALPVRAGRPIPPSTTPTRPAVGDSTPPAAGALTKPDEIRVLLNTAKGHPAKAIQHQADRIFDSLDRLRVLISEDEAKHAERRRIAAEKAEARAEVDRLKQELANAQAKLRGTTPSRVPGESGDGGPTSKEVRGWAVDNDVPCPKVGRVPADVRAAYDQAHPAETGDAA